MKKIRKAVIPAAGFGTRFLPATKAMPREMLPIVDKPTIQYLIEEILESGIEEILIISGYAKRSIEDHFDFSPELEQHLREHDKTDELKEIREISSVRVHYVRQKDINGLGGAVRCAREFCDGEPFALLLADDIFYTGHGKPVMKQLMEQYEKAGKAMIGCQKAAPEDVSKYGIIDGISTDVSGLYEVRNMIEKPALEEAPGNLAALGRYILTPEIFDILDMTKPGLNKEIQLTDALRVLAHMGKAYAYEFQGEHFNTGNKLGYLKAMVQFALRRDDLGEEFRKYLTDLMKEE